MTLQIRAIHYEVITTNDSENGGAFRKNLETRGLHEKTGLLLQSLRHTAKHFEKNKYNTKQLLTSSVYCLAVDELGLESNLRLEPAPSNPLSRGLRPLSVCCSCVPLSINCGDD